MASTRRMGVESSETRARLIEAAEEIIRDEGHAALTARRLAERVGLKRQIVHYYFRTIEDLLIAVSRSREARIRDRFEKALESDDPLRTIWELGHDVTPTMFEFMALAIRRKAVQAEVKRSIEEFRRLEAEALLRHLKLRGIESTAPPVVAALLVTSLSQTLAVEAALNVSEGHTETVAFIENCLRDYGKGKAREPESSS
jgi:AcrR family transcriptional regulator